MAVKLKIKFTKQRVAGKLRHYCFVGDMVVDGVMGEGTTKGRAAVDFIKKLNKDGQFGIYDKNQTI